MILVLAFHNCEFTELNNAKLTHLGIIMLFNQQKPLASITITFSQLVRMLMEHQAGNARIPLRLTSHALTIRMLSPISSLVTLMFFSLQAYAYCGCNFYLPDDLAKCANVELGIWEEVEPVSSVSLQPFSNAITNTLSGPIGPSISVSVTATPALISFLQPHTTIVLVTSVYTTTISGTPTTVTSVGPSTGVTIPASSGPTTTTTETICVQKQRTRVVRRDEI
jgi:hypothetical protein